MEYIKASIQTAGDSFPNCPPACKQIGQCISDAKELGFAESKSASHIAYKGEKGDVYRFPDGKEWEVSDVTENEITGYRSIVLKPLDSSDNRVILAYAGTNDPRDWFYGNLPLTVGDQYEQAAEIAKVLKEQYGDRLILTGHSLGGGLSTYASAMNGCIPSTGINSAPLHGNANGEIIASKCWGKNHTDYNTEWELVNNFIGFNWGEKIPVYGGGSFIGNLLKLGIPRHSLEKTAPCVPLPKKIKSGKSEGLKNMEAKRKEILNDRRDEAKLSKLDRELQEHLDKYHKESGYLGPSPQLLPRPKK